MQEPEKPARLQEISILVFGEINWEHSNVLYTKNEIEKLERLQRQAAIFIKNITLKK